MKTQYLIDSIETADPYKRYGKVKRVIGLMIESKVRKLNRRCLSHLSESMRKSD